MKRLKQGSIGLKLALFYLCLLSIVATLAPFIANEGALIPFSASSIDVKAMNHFPPFNSTGSHLLGTDSAGRDVLAGLIYGTRSALFFGFTSMFIALFIAIFLGGLSGFYQNDQWSMPKSKFYAIALTSLTFIILVISIPPYEIKGIETSKLLLALLFCILIAFLFYLISQFLFKFIYKTKQKAIPFDFLISRAIESIDALPTLFIIICFQAFLPSSIWSSILLLGCTFWVGLAKIIRAELIKVSKQDYVKTAIALGLPKKRILVKHALPNILSPVIVQFIFGISGCILMESTLNFLGIGTSITDINWGSMLAESGHHIYAWWLMLFPGILLFLTIYSLRLVANHIQKTTPDTLP